MAFLKKYASIFLVIFFTSFALLPLLHSGFFPIHDDEQIARLFDLHQSLSVFHIPPRIVPNLGYGYGYPFYNFYPPFAYYAGEVFHLFGFSYIISTKLMIAAGFILSAIFMYHFTKEYFGKIAGFVAAMLYTYAPYHAVDVYVRGALAEFWSFVFIPLLFWSYYKISQEGKYWYLLFAVISGAGLILSHNLIALMTGPFIGAYILYLFFTTNSKKRFGILSGIAVVLTLTLTAYFWLPSFFEKQYTLIDILTQELANYSIHFVCPSQFWNSAWGYGASVVSCQTDGLSFQVGKIQIILALLSIGVAFFLHIKKNIKTLIVVLFFAFFLFSLFIQTIYSKFIWDTIQPMWYIQFPWRFLVFSAFTSSFLAGAVFLLKLPYRIKLFIAGIFIGINLFLIKDNFKPEKYFETVTDASYVSEEKIRWDTSNLAYEYVPKGIATRKTQYGTTAINIKKDEIKKSTAHVMSGQMEITVQKDFPQVKQLDATVITPGRLQINTFSFPGWKVYVDGKESTYDDNNKLKLITLNLEKGTHNVTAKFSNTPLRLFGNILSVISLLALCALPFLQPYKALAISTKKRVK